MTRLVWLGAAVAAIFTVSPVHAISLGTLIDANGTITVGDKHFTNFELHDVTAQNSTPADPRNLGEPSECRLQRGVYLLA
jgi:hypothetical protein